MESGDVLKRLSVERLSGDRVDDFFKLHSIDNGCGWCFCVAWWTPTWQGWGERTAEENRRLRLELFERGEYDGYLAYIDNTPIGWCQVGRRNRLAKLFEQFNLQDDEDQSIWSITCFLVAPSWRRKKVATAMLAKILDRLAEQGAAVVEAYPKRGDDQDDLDLWNGAEEMYLQAGFEVHSDDSERPVLRRSLGKPDG